MEQEGETPTGYILKNCKKEFTATYQETKKE
jgi:hypothetical protein